MLVEFKDGKFISYLKTPPKLGFEVTLKSWMCVESLVISCIKLGDCTSKRPLQSMVHQYLWSGEEGQLDILSLRLNS